MRIPYPREPKPLPPLGSRPGAPASCSLTTIRVKPATVYTGPLPELVPCTPYRARLTVRACVIRWGIGNGEQGYQSSSERAAFAMKDRHSLCRGCQIGSERNAQAYINRPREAVSSPSEVGG